MSCMECPTCGCPEVCDCDRPNCRCNKSPLDLLTAESEFVRADALQQKCDKQERDLDATVTLLRSVVNDETWRKLNLTEAGKQYDALVAERDQLRTENLGLKIRIHLRENHNQNFERCESAWCPLR